MESTRPCVCYFFSNLLQKWVFLFSDLSYNGVSCKKITFSSNLIKFYSFFCNLRYNGVSIFSSNSNRKKRLNSSPSWVIMECLASCRSLSRLSWRLPPALKSFTLKRQCLQMLWSIDGPPPSFQAQKLKVATCSKKFCTEKTTSVKRWRREKKD